MRDLENLNKSIAVEELSPDIRFSYAEILYNEEYGPMTFKRLTAEEQISFAFNDAFINRYLLDIQTGERSALPTFSKGFLSRLGNLHIKTMKDLTRNEYSLCDKAACIGLFYNEQSYILVSGGVKVDDKFMFNTLTLMRSDYAPFIYNEPSSFMIPLCSESILYYTCEDLTYDGTLTVSNLVDALKEKGLIRFVDLSNF